MKRLLVGMLFAFLAFPFSGFAGSASKSSDAAFGIEDIAGRLPKDVFSEVSKIPEKPHFLQGYSRETDEWKVFLEQRRFFSTENLTQTGFSTGLVDKSKPGYEPPAGETTIAETFTLGHKDVKVLHAHYHITPGDGMYVFWSQKFGEKNLAEFSPLYRKFEVQWSLGRLTDAEWADAKRVLGWAQFRAVSAFVRSMIEEGLAKNLKVYNETMRLTERVIEIRAERLADPDYAKRLGDVLPGTSGLTNQDILPVPMTRSEDFLPDLFVITASEFTGGMTNAWTVPGSEVLVELTLGGLALQYIGGFTLAAHEMVHANPYLQGIPLQSYFDVEMWADMSANLDDGMRSYLGHPYLSVIRDVVRTTFGYNSEEVVRRIYPKGMMFKDVREDEFRKNVAEVNRIRDELVKFLHDPNDGMFVRFYSDPLYWVAVNTKFCDTAAIFRLMFAMRYEPAGIFDPNQKDANGAVVPPDVQTRTWLAREEESGNIKRLAEQALLKVGKESKFAKEFTKAADQGGIKCPVDSRFFFTDEPVRAEAFRVARSLIEQAQNGDAKAVFELKRLFGHSLPFPSSLQSQPR